MVVGGEYKRWLPFVGGNATVIGGVGGLGIVGVEEKLDALVRSSLPFFIFPF